MAVRPRRFAACALFVGGITLFALQPLAATADDGAKVSNVPPAEVIGEPISCVNIAQIRQTRVHDDSTIDFVMTGNRVYRNTLPQQCPTLAFDKAFSYATSQSQLCNVDIITVLRNIGGRLDPGPSCGLGAFVPVRLIAPPRDD